MYVAIIYKNGKIIQILKGDDLNELYEMGMDVIARIHDASIKIISR